MQVNIQYSYLVDSIHFLSSMNLKGKQSIHRTRFIKLLSEKLKQVSEEELQLIKEFAGIDANGDPNKKDDGSFAIEDVPEFKKQQGEYLSEYYVIEGGDAHGMLKTLKGIIENFDKEVSGKEADAFEHLFTAFENSQEKGGEESC
ncbi:hypothetical protein ABE28_009250 [Peribacillus muralis]|uniref:DUF1617 domain-containing protein n=1 Tax=Peribacillus muralis TaxID=264697 RepID=A0A1B3XMT8_9BACI|nr:hypothetical protein [Peribacillus muralis]AOH54534.1 hypothetical protein ABE28_009250 [Peribacillus muralis]